MNLLTTVTIPPQVLARQLGDETVILNLETGVYYGLDPVGSRIWELLGEGRSLLEVCAIMASEFEVPEAELEQDVLRIVGELHEQKLVLTD